MDPQPARIDYRNQDLSNHNFSGQDLNYAIFNHATLTNANFTGASLYNTRLVDVNLSGAIFTGNNFDGTWLNSANLSNAQLQNIHNVFSYNINLTGANLTGARNINFTGSILRDTILINADLSNCKFSRCNLTGANLTGANLTNTVFKNCLFNHAIFSNVIMDARTTFEECQDLDGIIGIELDIIYGHIDVNLEEELALVHEAAEEPAEEPGPGANGAPFPLTAPLVEKIVINEDDNNSCVLCLANYNELPIVKLNPCNHIYHQGCINQLKKRECPKCRENIISLTPCDTLPGIPYPKTKYFLGGGYYHKYQKYTKKLQN